MKCLTCNIELRHRDTLDTDWYGELTFYICDICKDEFVCRDGDENTLEIL